MFLKKVFWELITLSKKYSIITVLFMFFYILWGHSQMTSIKKFKFLNPLPPILQNIHENRNYLDCHIAADPVKS